MNVFLIGPSLYICSILGVFGDIEFSIMEILTFSTLISAVDPVAVLAIFQEVNVNKALYFLVFGESLLNGNAVVITLYNIWTTFVAADTVDAGQIVTGIFVSGGGLVIGLFLGIITSLTTRYTEHIKVVEPLVVVGFAYFSYITAELFHFSGIISLIACGIWQEEYARHNISKKSYTTIKYLTKTLCSVSDVIIFIFLGMVLIRDDHIWDTSFVVLTTIFCIVFRFAKQLLMAYGGLRGAIAFSLAITLDPKHIKQAELYITTTLFIILFTVFVMGSTTKPIVKLLRVQIHVKQEAKLFTEINTKFMETLMAGIEETAGQRSVNFWTQKLNRFNNSYIKAFLIRGGAVNKTKINIALDKITRDPLPVAYYTRQGLTSMEFGCDCLQKERQQRVEFKELPYDDHHRMSPAASPSGSRNASTQMTPNSSFKHSIHLHRKNTDDDDYSKALANAFSKSAYYQCSFRVVEDRDKKLTREMEKKSKWVNAKSKLSAIKRDSVINSGEVHEENDANRKGSMTMHSIVTAALQREQREEKDSHVHEHHCDV
ncbi:sodium/hydrogen exchanger 2-like protein, partial [Leptotrombidium deliense]